MKSQITFTKKDVTVTLGCLIFLLANLGAIGAGGRRRAKEALCLSNLRKWGVCFQLYANDNEGYFMRGWTPVGTRNTDYWMEALRQYYINPDLRCCPEAAIPGTELGLGPWGGNGTFVAWGAFWGDECGKPSPAWPIVTTCDYGSYGMNGYCYTPPYSAGTYQGHAPQWNWRTPNVAGGDNIPLFMDCQYLDGWPLHTNSPPLYDGQSWGKIDQIGRCCINRHSGYVNIAFLDFSARRVGLKELWTLKWHRQYDTCGPWTSCGGVIPNDWPSWMRDFEDY